MSSCKHVDRVGFLRQQDLSQLLCNPSCDICRFAHLRFKLDNMIRKKKIGIKYLSVVFKMSPVPLLFCPKIQHLMIFTLYVEPGEGYRVGTDADRKVTHASGRTAPVWIALTIIFQNSS